MKRFTVMGRGLLTVIALWSALDSSRAADLAAQYPATLDHAEQARGLEWTCGEKDVWRLTEFVWATGTKFRIEVGPAQVVFGCHDTNVVWAAIIPDEPGKLVAAEQGQGERVTGVWMRFHPKRLGDLFPAETVSGRGEKSMIVWGKRLAAHKIGACWQSDNRPVIPWKRSLTLDLDTREGPRRFYSIDTDAETVQYVDTFRRRPLPRLQPIDRATALAAFDTVWQAFDREYAMFTVKPNVDWAELRDVYRPRVEEAGTSYETAAVIGEMLARLEDLHVHVKAGGEHLPGYNRPRPQNARRKAVSHLLGEVTETRRDLAWGRTGDGIGYINVYRLSNRRLPELFDEVLGQMGDTKGLIVDLRFNGGGSEPLGVQIAGRLIDRRRVYSLNQYRNGPKHNDLGPKLQRTCQPSGPWHYTGPVIVLQGQRTMSSAESFLLALAQCPRVTTMGDRSAGSSANPRRVEAPGGITVNLPRWLDMDPQGKPVDSVGVAPDVRIETTPADFTDRKDPVLTAALEELRRDARSWDPSSKTLLKRRSE